MTNWNHIGYVANNEDARKLLALLLDKYNEDVSYNYITSQKIKRATIEKLLEFEMLETSKSIAYGYSKEYVIKSSLYVITNYGEKFYKAIKDLSTLSATTEMNVPLEPGEFKKFKKQLKTFIYSKNESEIREAYEFIFGKTGPSSDFYSLSTNKLQNISRFINRTKRDLFTVVKQKDYEEIITIFENKVEECVDFVQEIETVLRYDGKKIEELLSLLERYMTTSFYRDQAKLIEGVYYEKDGEDKLKTIVSNFINKFKSNGIYESYTNRISNICKVATNINNQLDTVKEQLSEKAKLLKLAATFDDLTQEEAEDKFTSLIANKKIKHISENDFAQFYGNKLYITPPELKERVKKEVFLISDEEMFRIRVEEEINQLQKKIVVLNTIQKILSVDIEKDLLPMDIYEIIRNSLTGDEEHSEFLTTEVKTSYNKNFTMKTELENGKKQRLTMKNSEVIINVNKSINEKIRKLEKKLAILTLRIAN